ncbi:MAG TPA: hypothetical protein PL110_19050 [Candidatus Eremiobacteraeota bacterium]|mgnify:CR=1 FL=1|nr:MAG: hypothetical protein BWY64_01521 [bacterium ADurb.Bin363]HPZ10196.1 hypothetical protein [Candidatus Eremiobacteraeota bacterium]
MKEEKDKKTAGIDFIKALNRPMSQKGFSTDGAWNLLKSKMQKSEVEENERDGKDFLELKSEVKEDIPRDSNDKFHSTVWVIQTPIKDGLDIFQKKEETPSKDKRSKVDKWERGFQPPELEGENLLTKDTEIQLTGKEKFIDTSTEIYSFELTSKETFIASSSEKQEVLQEKVSSLHLQISDITLGFEKRVIPFEKREQYLKEIEQYIIRKKKSLSRFYKSKESSIDKVKFFLNRGFDVFSQSLNELSLYLRDSSPIHLTLARELSLEGNRLFLKAKEIVKSER